MDDRPIINLEPFSELLDELGAKLTEAFEPFVTWYEDNQELIGTYMAARSRLPLLLRAQSQRRDGHLRSPGRDDRPAVR